jgi:hypothetical protein
VEVAQVARDSCAFKPATPNPAMVDASSAPGADGAVAIKRAEAGAKLVIGIF